MASRFSQRGGTFLGFLLGLTIGVGASAFVVFRMNHDSLPILDGKYLARPSADKTEQERIANWDPNRKINPSYSASGTVGAASSAQPNVAVSNPAPSGNGGNPAAGLVAPPASKPAATAAVTTAPVTQANTPKPQDKPATSGGYYLQIGSYKSRQAAAEQAAQLALQDFEASVSQTNSGGSEVFRVRMGPYPSVEVMRQMRNKLNEAGFSAFEIAPN